MRAYEFINEKKQLNEFFFFMMFHGPIQKLLKPWDEDIMERGIFPCFERNFNLPAEALKEEMKYPPDDPRTEIYVLVDDKEQSLLKSRKAELTEAEVEQLTPESIRGFYILRAINISEVHPVDKFPEVAKWRGRGVQGLCLALDKEYRGTKLGKELMQIPYSLGGYDYLWGEHLHTLGNLEHWLKRRELVIDRKDVDPPYYVTATRLH